MYLYSYVRGREAEPWWHHCPRLGRWISVWRNGELPLSAVITDPAGRLCPFCDLRGVVVTHNGGVFQGVWNDSLDYDGTRWRVNGPGGRPISW